MTRIDTSAERIAYPWGSGILRGRLRHLSLRGSDEGGACSDEVVTLRHAGDHLTVAGPLDVNVAVLAVNTLAAPNADVETQAQAVMSYDVRIGAGKEWTYTLDRNLLALGHGANAGLCVQIRPTQLRSPPVLQRRDLPCDFAAAADPNVGRFFPEGCESCGGLHEHRPPTCGPTLPIPVADGGCVRPRFFDGMFVTSEDLETQLRFFRLKNQLQNRAMGHGVVWGLDARMDGREVVVEPGYGVDCCGHDLTVTCDYRVSTAALLRDPAICAAPASGQRCMHLLLEYVECLKSPRPVHGNACNDKPIACEHSRVRETVRLRLVEPRDQSPANPLAEAVGRLLEAQQRRTETSSAGADSMEDVADEVPWELVMRLADSEKRIRPSVFPKEPVRFPPPGEGVSNLAFQMELDADSTFGNVRVRSDRAPGSGGSVSTSLDDDGNVTFARRIPSSLEQPEYREMVTIEWEALGECRLGGSTRIIVSCITKKSWLRAWVEKVSNVNRMLFAKQVEGGYVPTEHATIRLQIVATGEIIDGSIESMGTHKDFTVHVTGGNLQGFAGGDVKIESTTRSDVEVTCRDTTIWSLEGPVELPCCEAGCCEGEAIDPAANLVVLGLALEYGRLIRELGAQKNGEQKTMDPALAERAGQVIVKLASAFGIETKAMATNATKVIADLERLVTDVYDAWCRHAIYPGPACVDEPDGVVIGCALIKSGDICNIDPLDGRRWVLHPPLLEHWSAQFGLGTVDQSVMRLFSRLCCISHLPGFADLVRLDFPVRHMAAMSMPSALISSTASPLTSGRAVQVRRMREVDCMDFECLVSRLEEALCPQAGLRLQESAIDPPVGLVHDIAVAHLARMAPPDRPTRWFWSAVESFVESMLRTISFEKAIPDAAAGKLIHGPFVDAGIESIADVLSVPGEYLAEIVLAGKHPRALNATLDTIPSFAENVVDSVARVIKTAYDKKVLDSPKDLEAVGVRAAIADLLIKDAKEAEYSVDEAKLYRLLRARKTPREDDRKAKKRKPKKGRKDG